MRLRDGNSRFEMCKRNNGKSDIFTLFFEWPLFQEFKNITYLAVCKEPHNASTARPTLNWHLPPQPFAANDFNSIFYIWKSGLSHLYSQDKGIEFRGDAKNLWPNNGESTHQPGKNLDSAWKNINSTNEMLEQEECMTSNHFLKCGYIPGNKNVTNKVLPTQSAKR